MQTACLIIGLVFGNVRGFQNANYTLDAAEKQLWEFKLQHPVPIGMLTTSEGEPVEIRDTITTNSDLNDNQYYLDAITHADRERIPERPVHAKGIGAYGYFEVTNDVSKYTKAEVFNGFGKKTPVVVRFSSAMQSLGGTDFNREFKGLGVKFYTKEGNLDLTCLNVPIFNIKDPLDFHHSVHSFKRNPVTNLFDATLEWDFTVLEPVRILPRLWMSSDYGIPKSYRFTDMFPIHAFELSSKDGEVHYVRFNFRTEQGLDNFTSAEAFAASAEDPDYYNRDLYNAIATKNYPSWRLDIDVLTSEDIIKLNFNPFDLSTFWKNGTYRTVTIGRLVLNKHVNNDFKDSELSAYAPGNLVPGIPGPVDTLFKARRLFYQDSQIYRLGINRNNIEVNLPKYRKTYLRNGIAPVRENMKDSPNYYPNSFNGPVPYIDDKRPKKLIVLERNAIDFEQISMFYNYILGDDAHRQRTAENVATAIETAAPDTALNVIRLLKLAEPDLGRRVARSLKALKAESQRQTTKERYEEVAQCLERNMQNMP